ncbi:MAG: hypothetical protein Q4E64_05690 [Phascolarctobacterium sp.]|uniref:hypothetical protein n=1 Tax=Phascolarctobacterium sp. TaxID=2049039 RepID=UPI0026DC0363|nr:hypothetical protein [Phascolarctobacterium sp.]MDO4921300.1 hypothetical protein [Phascolarctobacterium sp.]
MQKIFRLLSCLCFAVLLAAAALPQTARADFPERPVGFVVIDHDGGVSGAVYKNWRQVVKWAYHFPYYRITDDGAAQQNVSEALRGGAGLDKASMEALAEKSKVDVLVVARVYEMDETMLSGGFFRDQETYVRVVADADLYVYKKDGAKFLKKKLRERQLRDLGNYDKPEETIKWELSKLVNTMEGRPIIGA